MAQFLNTEKLDLAHLNPITSWKGKTFNQITSSIKKNPGISITSTTNNRNLFLPNPLKLYRREIVNPIDMNNCYPRTSSSIDEINRPNGSIINSSSININGLVNTIDGILPKNTCDKSSTCLVFLSPSENAKRRCRSSGIIKAKYNFTDNISKYYTDSKQYLVSRNKTFQQNQYKFIRVGDPLMKPGPGLAASNIYSANGMPVCPKYYLPSNGRITYQWVDGEYYQVNFPSGYYGIDDFKSAFEFGMTSNYHYLIESKTGAKVFLINIIYDDSMEKIRIEFTPFDNSNFPSSNYSTDIRANSIWTNQNSGTSLSAPNPGPGDSLIPGIVIENGNSVLNALGLTRSSFPFYFPSVNINDPNNNQQTYTTTQVLVSDVTPGLRPIYKKIYYKPNNSKFAQQGAVSSSSLITRIKYDTVNTSAYKTSGNIYNNTISNTYGSNIANALAYGVSENPYTMKDKIGYPNISYPSFPKYSNVQRNCTDTHIAGGVKYNS
jgi:hypothetical protein